MLGIIIGVGAVIALMAAGQGAQAGVTSQVQGLGINLLFVDLDVVVRRSVGRGAQHPGADADDRRRGSDQRPVAGARGRGGRLAVRRQHRQHEQHDDDGAGDRATAATRRRRWRRPSLRISRCATCKLAAGDFFTQDDMTRKTLSVVSSARRRRRTSSTRRDAALGQTMRINFGPFNLNLTVVGVAERRGGSTGDDSSVIMPLTTFQAKVPFGRNATGKSNVQAIIVKVKDGQSLDKAKDDITSVLDDEPRHAGLHRAVAGRPALDIEEGEPDADDPARRDRRHLARRRRHRHHEHHARVGDRADARDRHPQGGRAPTAR